MKRVAKLLNDMVTAGIITEYAVFGAVAQMRYTEAVATLDADILVSVPNSQSLDLLSPIYAFCKDCGYNPEGESIRAGDWPVQFVPVFSALTEAAMHEAEESEIEGSPLRVVSAAYLAVIALSVGRAKDLTRILALREAAACTDDEIAGLAAKHGLSGEWVRFLERFNE